MKADRLFSQYSKHMLRTEQRTMAVVMKLQEQGRKIFKNLQSTITAGGVFIIGLLVGITPQLRQRNFKGMVGGNHITARQGETRPLDREIVTMADKG